MFLLFCVSPVGISCPGSQLSWTPKEKETNLAKRTNLIQNILWWES